MFSDKKSIDSEFSHAHYVHAASRATNTAQDKICTKTT